MASGRRPPGGRRGGARTLTEFVWRDGERTIRFGAGAGAHAWPGADVLTTARAETDIPGSVLEGARVHHVPSGQVPDLAAALKSNAAAARTFANFSPSCRREYVGWITEAKRPETRAKRLATTVQWLAEGKRRNWEYEL